MLSVKPTAEMVDIWKKVWRENKSLLRPNRKSGQEMLDYLKAHYILREIFDERMLKAVLDNVSENEWSREKLPEGASPRGVLFEIEATGAGCDLYEKQDEIFAGIPIICGIELVTGEFTVEGSSVLWDELFMFRGLDEQDIENFYLVYEYIKGLEELSNLQSEDSYGRNLHHSE